MDDEFAFNLLQDFDAKNGGKVSKRSSVQSPMHGLGLKRATSWSPGYVKCHERLRVHNIDPVASQLLRACAVSEEEEQEGRGTIVPLSTSSYEIGRISETDTLNEGTEMPIISSNKSGMPHLRFVAPSSGRRSKVIQTEERPLSPKPLFSGNLVDVKSGGANSLARPVPRRSSMPAIRRSAYL